MKPIPLTRSLLLKDLRHQRGWISLIWSLALLLPFAIRFMESSKRVGIESVTTFITAGLFLLSVLVLVRLVRLDAPGREFHFLATRPVPWGVLLGSKVLFTVLFLMLPVWIAKVGIMHMAQIPVNYADVAMLLVENTLCVGALLAGVALFSLFFRSVAVVFVLMAAAAMLIAYCAAIFRENPMPGRVDVTLQDCRLLVAFAGIIATAGAVAFFRYREKSLLKPLCILVAGLGISAIAWRMWPYDFSRLFADKPLNAGELPLPMRDRVKLELTGLDNDRNTNMTGGSWNGIRSINYSHQVTLDGVDAPYFAMLVDYHAEATLKSGRVIRSSYNDTEGHSAAGGMTEELQSQLIGIVKDYNGKWRMNAFDIFNYQPDRYRDEDLTGARIKGVLTLEIRRAFVVKTVPFKTGETVEMPRRRYVLEDVGRNEDATGFDIVTNTSGIRMSGQKPALEPPIGFSLVTDGVTSALRGDYPGWGRQENFSWAVWNRYSGERLALQSSSGGGGPRIWYNHGVEKVELRRDAANSDRVITGLGGLPQLTSGEWVWYTEISFFSSEPCGRISLPYEVKSVDLRH